MFTCWIVNSPVNMNIFTSLELGQKPQQAVILLLRPLWEPRELMLEISVEQKSDLILGALNQRTLLDVLRRGLAGGGEDEEHVQGAELHVVPHDVPQGVQGMTEELLVREILCPWRAEEHVNSIAFNCGNLITKKCIKVFAWS